MLFPSEAFTKDFSKLQDPPLSTAGIIQIKPSLQGTDIKAFTAGNVFTNPRCWKAEASRTVTMVREEARHSPDGWYLLLADRVTPVHSQEDLLYRCRHMKSRPESVQNSPDSVSF